MPNVHLRAKIMELFFGLAKSGKNKGDANL